MSAQERIKALVLAIREDIQRCEELIPLLSEQQRLLVNHDSGELNHVGEAIQVRLQRLESHGRERVEILQSLGLEASRQGLDALVGKLPAALGGKLRETWHQLETALACCQALNERNGELLANQRLALAELTGTSLNQYGDAR